MQFKINIIYNLLLIFCFKCNFLYVHCMYSCIVYIHLHVFLGDIFYPRNSKTSPDLPLPRKSVSVSERYFIYEVKKTLFNLNWEVNLQQIADFELHTWFSFTRWTEQFNSLNLKNFFFFLLKKKLKSNCPRKIWTVPSTVLGQCSW